MNYLVATKETGADRSKWKPLTNGNGEPFVYDNLPDAAHHAHELSGQAYGWEYCTEPTFAHVTVKTK